MNDPLQVPPEPIECPWCHSKYAPRLYGWHDRTEDGRNVNTRYTVRCLNCGAQGPKKEIGPHAIDAWNNRRKAATPVGGGEGSVPSEVLQITVRWGELLHGLVMDLRAHDIGTASVLRKEIDTMLAWVEKQKDSHDE